MKFVQKKKFIVLVFRDVEVLLLASMLHIIMLQECLISYLRTYTTANEFVHDTPISVDNHALVVVASRKGNTAETG